MEVGEVYWGDVDCVGLTGDNTGRWRAFVNVVMSLRVPESVWILSSGLTSSGLSSSAQLHIVR
jgi:hypothetical protein